MLPLPSASLVTTTSSVTTPSWALLPCIQRWGGGSCCSSFIFPCSFLFYFERGWEGEVIFICCWNEKYKRAKHLAYWRYWILLELNGLGFVLLFSTLVCCYPLELILRFFLFHKLSCGAAEATGLGFFLFVVINPYVLSANRVDLGFVVS